MEVRKRACPIDCSPRAMTSFKKSKVGVPVKFMYYDKGGWKEFDLDVCGTLRKAYVAGDRVVQLTLRSCLYVISFIQMLQVNTLTGCSRSIGWVYDSGEAQFPPSPVQGRKVAAPGKVTSAAHIALSARKAISGEESCLSFQADTPGGGGEVMECGKKLKRLGLTDSAFAGMRKVFLDGMGMFAAAAEVTGIYEVKHEGASGLARKESFERVITFTEKARGAPNVRHAWYGCSKGELGRIINHGFGRPTGSTYGAGIYLTPEKFSRLSCIGADVDDKGEQQLLFCRVVLGSSELVQAGSKQFHPSSELFDSGVDSLHDPKRFIVWSTHMNTHILPLYVASFKLPREWHEVMEERGKESVPIGVGSRVCKVKENDRTVAVPKLFSVLKPELSATDMSLLEQSYMEFKNGKLSQEEFLRKVRNLAGDQKLKKIQEQVLRNSIFCGLFLQGKLLEMSSRKPSVAG